MKRTTRLIAMVSAVLMILIGMAACRNPGEGTDVTTSGIETNGTETTNSNLDSKGYLKDNLPDDLDYKGANVNVLYWSDAERPEFVITEGITGDIVKDAIIERNTNIEERLGVKLNFIGIPGNNTYRGDFVNKVMSSYKAGDRAYDIIGTYSRTAGMLSIQGYLADLHSIEDSYIDESMPWWPSSLLETAGVGDALYYISGDASTNTLHFMYTIYYNKQLIINYGLTDPTEYVLNNTWTQDKLIEMTSNVYNDLDGSGGPSEGDFFGFTTIYYGCDAFYTGSNMKLVEQTGDSNLLKISDDFYSEKCINLVDHLGKWLNTSDCYVSRSGGAVNFQVPFVNGNALFCQNRVYMADNMHTSGLNAVEWKYGLVPTPMYDENQADYVTVTGNPFSLYGIMNDCANQSMMTAVIECWGSEAYRLTTPALFETNMKYKYSQEEVSAKMFDILRRTQVFDQGRIFSNDLSYMSELPSKAMTDGNSWATGMKSYQKVLTMAINRIVTAFQKHQA